MSLFDLVFSPLGVSLALIGLGVTAVLYYSLGASCYA